MNLSWPNDLDLSTVSSPGLLVDADGVASNIQCMLAMVGGDPSRLRPHVKTHKMSQVIRLQRAAGIDSFKVATLAEAEMVAGAGGHDVLIAYQLVGPNLDRLVALVNRYPDRVFSSVVDHPDAVAEIARRFADPVRIADQGPEFPLLIDVDCGMHRTGIEFGPEFDRLRGLIELTSGVRFAGLHVYDGHVHDSELEQRRAKVEAVQDLVRHYEREHLSPCVVGGGSPTFGFWAKSTSWQCSPGTPVFWDVGYGSSFPDLEFRIATALVTRVISKPGSNRICLDLGYKSVAAEMPLERRVLIPAIPDAELIGQSEEHLVVGTQLADSIPFGTPMLALPRHICPTIALHDFATVIRGGEVTDERWIVDARGR